MTNEPVWTSDDCYDPSHRQAYVRVNGETWHLHDALGPGWGFTARPEPYNRENAGRVIAAYSFREFLDAVAAERTAS